MYCTYRKFLVSWAKCQIWTARTERSSIGHTAAQQKCEWEADWKCAGYANDAVKKNDIQTKISRSHWQNKQKYHLDIVFTTSSPPLSWTTSHRWSFCLSISLNWFRTLCGSSFFIRTPAFAFTVHSKVYLLCALNAWPFVLQRNAEFISVETFFFFLRQKSFVENEGNFVVECETPRSLLFLMQSKCILPNRFESFVRRIKFTRRHFFRSVGIFFACIVCFFLLLLTVDLPKRD